MNCSFFKLDAYGLDRDYNALLARETAVAGEAEQLRQEYIALMENTYLN